MSQIQGEWNITLDALRAAATTGRASALRNVRVDVVLLHEEKVFPELLQLCCPNEPGRNPALLNAAWKLLLSVASLSTVTERMYNTILQFMFSKLRHHVLSHDWSDIKQMKLATFVASHAVSGVRAHPSYAARNTDLVKMTVELYSIVCLTVGTSERVDAARLLHQNIGVRILAILEAMGLACNGLNPLSVEEQLQLILHCFAVSPLEVTEALKNTSVAAISSLTAFSAMMAVLRSMLLSESVCAELLLTASLLWLPGMRFVFADGDDDDDVFPAAVSLAPCEEEIGAAVCRQVARHARDVPYDLFFAECDSGNDDAPEAMEELCLDAQLLSVLQGLAYKSVCAMQRGDRFDEKRSSSRSSLLCCPVFGILLVALLAPNDSSTAKVLLVWETVLSSLSDADRETLATELLHLGEDQLCAIREFSNMPNERLAYLRRFLNAIAVLLAEVCRLLRRHPSAVAEKVAGAETQTFLASSHRLSFCRVADALYHQTRVYQWWNEEIGVGDWGAGVTEVGRERKEMIGGTQKTIAAAASFQEELQVLLGEWQRRSSSEVNDDVLEQVRVVLISVPRRVGDMLQKFTSSSGSSASNSGSGIMALLLAATRLIQSVAEAMSSTPEVCVCARFVAGELVAVMGFVPSEDPAFLACLRRLVDIGFSTLHGAERGAEEVATHVDGILLYHAAVCLQHFAQHNTFVSLGKLRLSGVTSAALMQLLQGKKQRKDDDDDDDDKKNEVDDSVVRACESLLMQRACVWQQFVSRSSQVTAASNETMCSPFDLTKHSTAATTSSSSLSSQNVAGCQNGRFFLPLQRCENTLLSLLEWQEKAGHVLQSEEEEILGRLEQLVCAAVNTARATPASTGDAITSTVAAAVSGTKTKTMMQGSGEIPEVIQIN